MVDWMNPHPAFKLFIKDLTNLTKIGDYWTINFGNETPNKTLCSVHLQVEVLKLSGLENEVLLVTDSTGKAKITRGPNVPGEFSWLKNGSVCSVVGKLVESCKIPHVEATKISEVYNKLQLEMWPLEVEELRGFLSNTVVPNID